MRAKTEEVRRLADARKDGFAEELHRRVALEGAQIELRRLDEARQVIDHQDRLALVAAQIREHRQVGRVEELDVAPTEDGVALADGDQPPHPVEQRAGAAQLGLDVDRLVVIDGVDHQRQIQGLRVGA